MSAEYGLRGAALRRQDSQHAAIIPPFSIRGVWGCSFSCPLEYRIILGMRQISEARSR